jgi:hypothetical protein
MKSFLKQLWDTGMQGGTLQLEVEFSCDLIVD